METYQAASGQVLDMELVWLLWSGVVDVNERDTSKIDSNINTASGLEDYWRQF